MLRKNATISRFPMSSTTQSTPLPIPELSIAPPKGWHDLNLTELWHSRELLYFFVWKDVKVRYKQTAIGAAWAILQPLLTMLIFTLFFGRLAKIPSEGLPYPLFYYCALLPWLYFAGSLQNATNVIVEQQRVITKVYFPRLVLPLSAVTSPLLDFGIGFSILVLMLIYYKVHPTLALLALPLFLALAILTALGVGLFLSAMNAMYRDVRYVVPFLVQFWMFLSPVAYPSSLVPARWRWLYGLNPMAGIIEGFRWSLTGSGEPPSALLAASSAAVVLVVISGMVYFQKMEGIIADVV
jgi:lipopolysaccharide transport system permease protein